MVIVGHRWPCLSFHLLSLLISARFPLCFFPKADPNQIYVYLQLPVGTNVDYTDSVTKMLEKRVIKVLGHGEW